MQEKQRFLCENSLDGLFTAVYDAWDSRCGHENVELAVQEPDNLEFFCREHRTATDPEKAARVARTLRRRLGSRGYEILCYAAASQFPDKGTALYQSIVCLLTGRSDFTDRRNPHIRRLMELYKNSFAEFDHLRGFLRFRELSSGALASLIRPKNDLLLFLGAHFQERMPEEAFLICDSGRSRICFHKPGADCSLISGFSLSETELSRYSSDAETFENLFRTFCRSISIRERENPALQRQMLPLRFREFMPEFRQTQAPPDH